MRANPLNPAPGTTYHGSMIKHTLICALALGLAASSPRAAAQDAYDFYRGATFPPPRDAPAAWLAELHKADDLLGANIAVATFLPNTRLAWHNHPAGQILIITDGVGYYQEQGQTRQIVRRGDVIKCLPGVQHWHGAAVESAFSYIAISPAQKGPTVWAQPVTDEEYRSPARDRRTAKPARKSGASSQAKLLAADTTFPFEVSSTSLGRGARLPWHKDGGGQILIVTDGAGYFQEREQQKHLLRKGDIVENARDTEHWYGAASEIDATFLTITPVSEAGTKWLTKVTDEEYRANATIYVKHGG